MLFPLFPGMHGQAARTTCCHLRQELRGQLYASSQLLPRLTLPRQVWLTLTNRLTPMLAAYCKSIGDPLHKVFCKDY